MNIQSRIESIKIRFKQKFPNVGQIEAFNSTTVKIPKLELARIYIHEEEMDTKQIKIFNNTKNDEYKNISYWNKIDDDVGCQAIGALTLFRISNCYTIKAMRAVKVTSFIAVVLIACFSIYIQNIAITGLCLCYFFYISVNHVIFNN